MRVNITFPPRQPSPPPSIQYWTVLHNPAVPMDGRPDVVVTADDEKHNNVSAVKMTEQIQRLSYDLFSWGLGDAVPDVLKPLRWRALYQQDKAFTNGAGYDKTPPRCDYINKLDLSAELPILQKGITIAGSKVTGRIVGNNLEMDTLSPANIPSLAWLIAHPWLYFEAKTVNEKGQARFALGNGAPVYVPWFCQAGKVARLPLSMVTV